MRRWQLSFSITCQVTLNALFSILCFLIFGHDLHMIKSGIHFGDSTWSWILLLDNTRLPMVAVIMSMIYSFLADIRTSTATSILVVDICFRFLWFQRQSVQIRLWNIVAKTHFTLYLKQTWFKNVPNCSWKLRKRCGIGHSELISFMNGLFYRIIMTKSLPLSIHRVHTSAWKDALFYKPLPIDLIFILFTWEILRHTEDFNQFTNCKSSSLSRQLLYSLVRLAVPIGARILYFGNDVLFHWESFSLIYHID